MRGTFHFTESKKPTISVSKKNIGTLFSLSAVMAHEMVHCEAERELFLS